MRIAYATTYDATNTARGFSSYNGVGYHMGRSLQRAGFELEHLGPLREAFSAVLLAKQQLVRRCAKKSFNRHRERLACKRFSRQIDRQLSRRTCDMLFSGPSTGSQPVAYVRTELPLTIWTDCTLASAVAFYPEFSRDRMYWPNVEAGLANERRALARATTLIFASEWARLEAIAQYDLPPEKVHVVPFGANQLHEPDEAEVFHAIETRSERVCKLLFIGVDWHRKGGAVAVAAAEQLHRAGVRVELNIVGGQPENLGSLPPYVRVHGLITRSTREGAQKLRELFSQSHFLILPSRADSSPHVLVEANSHGLPCVASNVGGISSIIEDDRNGMLFPAGASGKAYAAWITEVFGDAAQYRNLAHASFEEYQMRLNWRVAGRAVARLLLPRPVVVPKKELELVAVS